MGELSLWRKERLGDAGIVYRNSAFSGLVRRWLERPENSNLQRRTSDMDQPHSGGLSLQKVALLDVQGGQRMSVPDTKEPISSVVRQKVQEALRSGQMTFVDFYRNEHSQKVYLGLLVPLLDAQDGGRPIGVCR